MKSFSFSPPASFLPLSLSRSSQSLIHTHTIPYTNPSLSQYSHASLTSPSLRTHCSPALFQSFWRCLSIFTSRIRTSHTLKSKYTECKHTHTHTHTLGHTQSTQYTHHTELLISPMVILFALPHHTHTHKKQNKTKQNKKKRTKLKATYNNEMKRSTRTFLPTCICR